MNFKSSFTATPCRLLIYTIIKNTFMLSKVREDYNTHTLQNQLCPREE